MPIHDTIEELKKLEAKATKGPRDGARAILTNIKIEGVETTELNQDELKFISAVLAAFPSLIAELERLDRSNKAKGEFADKLCDEQEKVKLLEEEVQYLRAAFVEDSKTIINCKGSEFQKTKTIERLEKENEKLVKWHEGNKILSESYRGQNEELTRLRETIERLEKENEQKTDAISVYAIWKKDWESREAKWQKYSESVEKILNAFYGSWVLGQKWIDQRDAALALAPKNE